MGSETLRERMLSHAEKIKAKRSIDEAFGKLGAGIDEHDRTLADHRGSKNFSEFVGRLA